MIIGSLNDSGGYNKLHPLFPKAFDFLKSLDLEKPQLGKFEIDGNDLFVSISESTLRTSEKAKLEVHNKYIDIQIPLSKSERFGWKSRDKLNIESAPFNLDKDIQFFEDKAETYFDIEPGVFVIFFPNDAHAPCIGDGYIIKIVIKVKVKVK